MDAYRNSIVVRDNKLNVIFTGICCVACILLPAIWNGFPLIFSDSGTYVNAAIQRQVPGDRTVFYSVFLYLLHWKINLWPPVVVQAMISYYLIRLLFLTFSRTFRERDMVLPVLALTAFSSLPWFADQLMPDIFSGLLILAIAIGVLGQQRLQPGDRLALCALTAFFITTHLANLPIAIGTFVMAVLARGAASRHMPVAARLFSRPNLQIFAAIVVAVSIMLGINIALKKGVTFARTGNVMMMAKLMDQGIGIDYLERTCPERPLPICAIVPRLRTIQASAIEKHSPIGTVSDTILWGGPLTSLGGMLTVTHYASEINSGTLKMFPLQFMQKSLQGFFSQVTKFTLGDDLTRYDEKSLVYQVIKKEFKQDVFAAYLHSRQYTNAFNIDVLKSASNVFLICCALVVAGQLFAGKARINGATQLTLTLLAGMLANAFVTGALSAVHDRYGSRVIWLIPLLALFILSELISNRKPAVHGVPQRTSSAQPEQLASAR